MEETLLRDLYGMGKGIINMELLEPGTVWQWATRRNIFHDCVLHYTLTLTVIVTIPYSSWIVNCEELIM